MGKGLPTEQQQFKKKKKIRCGGCSKLTKASKYLDLPFENGQQKIRIIHNETEKVVGKETERALTITKN
jgi:hypothetical protein